MSNQATMNFDQALPHLRRGFILRIHGAKEFDGALLQESGGKLEFSRGDGNWGSAADVPVLDLAFDIYDQKRVDVVDYTKPLVDRDDGAKAKAQQLANAKSANELGQSDGNDGTRNPSVDEAEEELQLEALRILRDQGVDDPSNEQVNDLVAQLKAKANELTPVTEQGGGNTPEAPPPDGLQSLTQGYNELQTDQVKPEEAAGGLGAEPIADEQLFDTSGDDEGDLPDETTQVAEGDQSTGKRKRGKRH